MTTDGRYHGGRCYASRGWQQLVFLVRRHWRVVVEGRKPAKQRPSPRSFGSALAHYKLRPMRARRPTSRFCLPCEATWC